MSDHHTSYIVNSMLGGLFLNNKAFQSLPFQGQQSIVMDLIGESNPDMNLPEILSNECFSEYQGVDEKRTLACIFKICSYCAEVKDVVEDYLKHNPQGFCPNCAQENFSEEDLEKEKVIYLEDKKRKT